MRLGGIFLLAAVFGGTGVASASEVSVRLVGENGPLGAPAYVVTVDDTFVGAGVLPAPEGALPRERTDLSTVATDVSFTIPDGVLQTGSAVKVRLINDSWDPNTGVDTTLYVLGVSIDGVAADVAAATITTLTGEAKTTHLTADGALIVAWSAAASFAAPEGGWTHAASAEAESGAPASTADTTASEAAPAVVEEGVTEEPASAEAVEPTCEVSATIALTDFANGEAYVTQRTAQELSSFFKGVSVEQCKLEVNGYSSPGGEPAINLAVSQARADAVLQYIGGRNLHFVSQEAVGRGETTEFGDGSANRRVVVSVGP